MTLSKLVLFLGIAAMAMASSNRYSIAVSEPIVVAGTEFRAGKLSLELDGQMATLREGKKSIATPVKVETAEETYRSSSVRWDTIEGKHKLREIRVGGTNLRLTFED